MTAGEASVGFKPVLLRLLRSPLLRMIYFVSMLSLFTAIARWVAKVADTPANSLKSMSANLASTTLTVLPFLLAYWLLAKVIERRPLSELDWRKSPQLLWGLLAALLLFALVTAELWAANAYTVSGWGDAPLWTLFLLTAVVPGITEEIISRGILFRLTEEGLGTWIALLVSALFFGFAHITNPGATAWSSIAISIEAGLLFGLLYHVTRSLWWCIGLHAGWNFVQGAVFGIPVSGIPVDGLLESQLQGPDWLDGGGFGAEASVLTVLTCGVISLWLLQRILHARSMVAPFWKREQRTDAGVAALR
ncbi:CPBP family intramembrane metalloprotease domain-containing protein [Pseudoxanthomonas yeongjuensis]|uniref:CPBP family intramembrane glutamic endopeptidase n=1 Tax=Pseudoxanthomonas yeongjuensis TaxID=377616 RepID=UPI001390748B|nr:CPBP family intramembrane glutamic endopeptidase [Pseudoxanthomonas yeongjuensis]KAF1718556.1 CPBP family intramembrane metalloprotease domain-containing protein [Pseudoxanthomonas yeongjuensis]